MIRITLFCLLTTAGITVAGCGQSRVSTMSEPKMGQLVGGDELLSSGRPWLLDALRVVRPGYFIPRGQSTLLEQRLVPMVVVINGMVLPDLEVLRSTAVSDVMQVRRLSVAETYNRYNRSVSVGALEVVLRRR
ncbi:MAG: hypothetical protein M3Z10_09910 [Gemmatimonadota bacterium]|nr:hypothetical protein [Gemmatimonadota bacterium]